MHATASRQREIPHGEIVLNEAFQLELGEIHDWLV